jgi:hypothetical protein
MLAAVPLRRPGQLKVVGLRNELMAAIVLVRYKPKSIAALHIALGGLPDKMRVEVDPGIQPSPKTVGGTSEDDRVAREFGHNNSAGTRSQQRCKGEQSERSDSHCAETVGRT